MKLKIEVGEPRGFDAGDKTNAFIGTVVDGLSGSREMEVIPTAAAAIVEDKKVAVLTEHWFVVSCNPITHDGMRFSSILFIPRYKSKKSPLEMMSDGERLVFNGVWRQDGKDWDQDSIKAAQDGNIDIGGMIVANASLAAE